MHDTHVVHVTDNIPDAVYIGRANGRARLAASPFANPFPLAMGDRDTVLLRYRDYLRSSQRGVPVIRRLPELRGKPLACWCRHEAEKRTARNACHGDVPIELLNRYTDDELRNWEISA